MWPFDKQIENSKLSKSAEKSLRKKLGKIEHLLTKAIKLEQKMPDIVTETGVGNFVTELEKSIMKLKESLASINGDLDLLFGWQQEVGKVWKVANIYSGELEHLIKNNKNLPELIVSCHRDSIEIKKNFSEVYKKVGLIIKISENHFSNHKKTTYSHSEQIGNAQINLRIRVEDLRDFINIILNDNITLAQNVYKALGETIIQILKSDLKYLQKPGVNLELILTKRFDENHVGLYSDEKSNYDFYKIFLNYESLAGDLRYAATNKKIGMKSQTRETLVHEITHAFDLAGSSIHRSVAQESHYFNSGAETKNARLLMQRIKEEGLARLAQRLKLSKNIFGLVESLENISQGLESLANRDPVQELVHNHNVVYGVGELIHVLMFVETANAEIYYNKISPNVQLHQEPSNIPGFLANTKMLKLGKNIQQWPRDGYLYIVHDFSVDQVRQFFSKMNLIDLRSENGLKNYAIRLEDLERKYNVAFFLPNWKQIILPQKKPNLPK